MDNPEEIKSGQRNVDLVVNYIIDMLSTPEKTYTIKEWAVERSYIRRLLNGSEFEFTIIREIVAILSLSHILEKVITLENSVSRLLYILLAEVAAQLPEFTKSLLKRTDIWIQINEEVEQALEKEEIDFAVQVSMLIAHLISMSRARDLDLVMESRLIETIVCSLEKDVPLEKKTGCEDCFKTSVSALGMNCLFSEKCRSYFRDCGVMRHLHLFNERISKYVSNGVQWELEKHDRMRDSYSHEMGTVKCQKCRRKEGENKFKTCNRCKSVFYCSRACQKCDWESHKKNCISFKMQHES